MSAATYNITIEQGAVWTRTLTISDAGEPRDLTGYTVRMQIRATPGAAVILEASTDDGRIVLTSAVGGELTITIEATTTAAVVVSGLKAHYDLELVPPSGEDAAQRLLMGTVTFSPEITI